MTAPAWGFTLRGEGSETLELDIFDIIGEGFWTRGVTAKDVRYRLKEAKNAKTIRVKINSRGGDVVDGLAIHNLLAEHEADVQVEIVGLAASMASVIAMAGDTISMASSAFLMIHNPWGIVMGESEDLRAHADLLDKMRDTLVGIYAARTGLGSAEVTKMMAAETWLKADEAKDKGFADKVTKPKKTDQKATAMAFAAIDPKTYANLPEELRAVAAGTTQPPAERAEEQEDDPMALSAALLAALCLPHTASEADAVAAASAFKTERDDARRQVGALEQVIGGTGEDAIGKARAHKASHEKLPALEKQVAETKDKSDRAELAALLKQGRDDKKLTKAEADKLQAQVESYWAAKAKGEEPPDDAMSLGAAKSFIGCMLPKPTLAGDPPASRPPEGAKPYEAHTPNELAALRQSEGGEETYQAMRTDWIARGRPKKKSA